MDNATVILKWFMCDSASSRNLTTDGTVLLSCCKIIGERVPFNKVILFTGQHSRTIRRHLAMIKSLADVQGITVEEERSAAE